MNTETILAVHLFLKPVDSTTVFFMEHPNTKYFSRKSKLISLDTLLYCLCISLLTLLIK